MKLHKHICKVCKRESLRQGTLPKFCSRFCQYQWMRLNPSSGAFKKGHKPMGRSLPGHTTSEVTKRKISLANMKEKVSYHSIHTWVRRSFGRPDKCERCGILGKISRGKWTIQWASKNRQYTRERTDWISLCVFCHREYDLTKRGSVSFHTKSRHWRADLTVRGQRVLMKAFLTKPEAEQALQEAINHYLS